MTDEKTPAIDPALFGRVKGILLQPRLEWAIIAAEQTTVKGLFNRYAVILAAIGPVAKLVNDLVIGGDGPIKALLLAACYYGVNLLLAYILGIVIDGLAHNFGSQKNTVQSMKVAVYAMTPYWVVGALCLLSVDLGSTLAVLSGFYGIYLMCLGMGALKGTPQGKTVGYAAAVTVIWMILACVVMGMIGSVIVAFSVMEQGASLIANAL